MRRRVWIGGALASCLPLAALGQAPDAAAESSASARETASATDAADVDADSAQSADSTWSWAGIGSLAAIAASGTRDLDDVHGRVGLAVRGRLEGRREGLRILVEVGGGSHALGHDDADFVRQAYVELPRGDWQWRVGRQIHAWGRADRINPTDNLGARNPRALVTDIDEERKGVDGLSLKRTLGPRWSLTLIGVPRLRATTLPRAVSAALPRQDDNGPTHALRADYSGEGLDGSASVLEGESLLPAAHSNAVLRQPRVRVWGADFSRPLGEVWGLRGEVADTHFIDPPPPGLRDQRFAVLGVERHFGAGWLGVAQWVHRRVRGPLDSGDTPLGALNRVLWAQLEPRSDALYFGINRSAFEGDLSGDFGLLQSLDNRSRAWFGQAVYRLDDRWELRGRWQHFSGPPQSQLGALQRDSLLMLELRAQLGLSP